MDAAVKGLIGVEARCVVGIWEKTDMLLLSPTPECLYLFSKHPTPDYIQITSRLLQITSRLHPDYSRLHRRDVAPRCASTSLSAVLRNDKLFQPFT
eukprot:5836411-Pyramimonas_sp.AAC.1